MTRGLARSGRRVAHRKRLRTIRPVGERPRGRGFPFWAGAFLLVGSLVFGVVSIQALASQSSFRIVELSRRNSDLRQSNGELRLELAELTSPRRIAAEARRRGLVLPSEVHPLVVEVPPKEGKAPTPGGP